MAGELAPTAYNPAPFQRNTEVSQAADVSLNPADASPASRSRVNFVHVLAVACGICVGNMYYNQPLLAAMARTFHTTVRGVGAVAMLTQFGYALGMLLLVPLGDVLPRRKLIVSLLLTVAVMLLAVATARSLVWLAAASLLVGFTTVVPQILIPFAAKLAKPAERGKAVGTVMMGLLLGILLSRTVAGFVGARFGWRAMFVIAAAMMVTLSLVLGPLLPAEDRTAKLRYADLLRSVWSLARRERTLQEAMLTGGLMFGGFSVFWATLAFRVETPPLHYGERAAGLFGLVGASGALVAPIVGHWTDRVSPRHILTYAIWALVAAFIVFWAAGHTIPGLIVGVLLLDVAVQGGMVANQSRIYSLSADAHSRVNSAYMVFYFLGGSLGSLLGTTAWGLHGWPAVCATGIALAALAMLAHVTLERD